MIAQYFDPANISWPVSRRPVTGTGAPVAKVRGLQLAACAETENSKVHLSKFAQRLPKQPHVQKSSGVFFRCRHLRPSLVRLRALQDSNLRPTD
jgi:hypothetical protein